MKVLVIGATGVVGRQLVPQLLTAGHQVVATSHSHPAPEATVGQVAHRRLGRWTPLRSTRWCRR